MAKIATSVLLLLYPVLIYFGLAHFEPRSVGLVLVVAALAQLWAGRAGAKPTRSAQTALAVAVSCLVAVLVLMSNDQVFLKLYPVCMNGSLLILFGFSLLYPPSLIERFARLRHPDLSPSAVEYTRKVTWAWCGFFLLNGSMAAYTSFACSLETWTLYNGLIAYGLIGLMFAGEYVARGRLARA